MDRRSFIIAGSTLLWIAAVAPALAGKAKIYTGPIDGVGAGGYDVVAYQTEGAARPGDAAITVTHEGVVYRFASAANLKMFQADPARYLPQFGGYCAWAVASGYTAHADPEAWNMVDGKLYLNYSKSIRARWARDPKANITKGEANWPKVLE
jgi:YHS domain-containing protein